MYRDPAISCHLEFRSLALTLKHFISYNLISSHLGPQTFGNNKGNSNDNSNDNSIKPYKMCYYTIIGRTCRTPGCEEFRTMRKQETQCELNEIDDLPVELCEEQEEDVTVEAPAHWRPQNWYCYKCSRKRWPPRPFGSYKRNRTQGNGKGSSSGETHTRQTH